MNIKQLKLLFFMKYFFIITFFMKEFFIIIFLHESSKYLLKQYIIIFERNAFSYLICHIFFYFYILV